MADLSDLDLVAQAMAPSNQPDKPHHDASAPTKASSSDAKPDPEVAGAGAGADADAGDFDLSSLTPEDLALLQPLLAALNVKDPEDMDESSLLDILAQMDAAGDVADDLEGKLDRLIGELGKVEEGILDGMDDKDPKEDEAGEAETKEK